MITSIEQECQVKEGVATVAPYSFPYFLISGNFFATFFPHSEAARSDILDTFFSFGEKGSFFLVFQGTMRLKGHIWESRGDTF